MENRQRIVVLIPLDERCRERLAAIAPQAEILYPRGEACTGELLESAHVIIGNPEVSLLKNSPNLRWLQLGSAGANGYVEPGALPKGVVLTNATGAYGLAVSEYMVGVLFMLYKKLQLYRDNQRASLWKPMGRVRAIRGSTVLVVGLGDIGGEFAMRMKALGARTIGVRRSDHGKPDYMDEVHLMEDLDDLLPLGDCVALCLPGTPATYKLFDARRLSLMKEGAVLLNVGRGSAVDTNALCDALESGHLSGAALDVTDPEPLPADHRIWSLPQAVITPHVSGGHSLEETSCRIFEIAAKNLERYVQGEPLENLVDLQTGYRVTPRG